jgi:hypothetical protein
VILKKILSRKNAPLFGVRRLRGFTRFFWGINLPGSGHQQSRRTVLTVNAHFLTSKNLRKSADHHPIKKARSYERALQFV